MIIFYKYNNIKIYTTFIVISYKENKNEILILKFIRII
jgi:hypothetical protein